MRPTTLHFMLANETAGTFGGTFAVIVAAVVYYFHEPLPVNPHFTSPIADLVPYLIPVTFAVGVFMLVTSWRRASRMRNGTR